MATGLGTFLRTVRRRAGLSQAELADVTGIAQPNISAYEREQRTPRADALVLLLAACGHLLVAESNTGSVVCPLPKVGWFPDDDDPPALDDDPSQDLHQATTHPGAEAVDAILELIDAIA